MVSRHQLYNKYKRDKDSKRFYNSKAWEVCRTNVLIRDFYLCQECLKKKIIKVYDVVHHIKPLRDYPELALVEDNLISLCHECHNKAESLKEEGQRNIFFIEEGANEEIV